MRFRCEKYPSLCVFIGGERSIRFTAGIYETEDAEVIAVLKMIDYITAEEVKKPAAAKKAGKK